MNPFIEEAPPRNSLKGIRGFGIAKKVTDDLLSHALLVA
jgi:hypothetical protein